MNIDFRHYAIELLRVAEGKGMTHEHALNIYREFDKDMKDGRLFGDALDKLKFSVFHSLYPDIELGSGDIFCDKCDRVIVDGEKRVFKNDLVTWCAGCEKELQDILAERRRMEEEAKRAEEERKRLADEERRKNYAGWLAKRG